MDNTNDNALKPGTLLQGKSCTYTIQKVLGQGTFGITYLATTLVKVHGTLGELETTLQVAIKEFFMRDINGRKENTVTTGSQGGIYANYKKKFAREAENLSKLHHPHIVKVLEYFEANNTVYYAMEYVEGGSLDTYITQQNGLPETECVKYAKQIGSALSYMHAHKMLHLDLKPGNIMLRPNKDAVLIDFGLSKQYNEKGEPESSTSVGSGTPGYAPIEQANYHEGKDFPVTMDVYALGAPIYKMVTGVRAPKASDILNDGFPAYKLQEHQVSNEMITCIAKAMTPMKKDRPQSVENLLTQLENENTLLTSTKPANLSKIFLPFKEVMPLTDAQREDLSALYDDTKTGLINRRNLFKGISHIHIKSINIGGVWKNGSLLIFAKDVNGHTYNEKEFRKKEFCAWGNDQVANLQLFKEQFEVLANSLDITISFGKLPQLWTPEGQYKEGKKYYNNKEFTEAVKWYHKAAEQKHTDAQICLGFCYRNGLGVKTDYAEAAKWFRMAAEAGNADAQYHLGYCYEAGLGVEQNNNETAKWYHKAAEQGEARAQCYLGDCYYYGRGVEQNYIEAVKWYKKSAEQGYPYGQLYLGQCYEKGQGVEQNDIEADKWYMKCEAQGVFAG